VILGDIVGHRYDFKESILGILILGAFLLFFLVDFLIKKNRRDILSTLLIYSVIVYILCLIKVVFFPIYTFKDTSDIKISMFFQVIPFKSIIPSLKYHNWIQVIGNMALLFPVGVYLKILSKRVQSLKKVLVVSLLLTLSIECIQLIIDFITHYPNKVFDIDDIILNVIGCIAGWKVAENLLPHLKKDNPSILTNS
jgi:glycopeptide antibiotics resistance protein